ncbi:MAG: hypothetical protein WC737_05750 [Parcubacteria group bacterium]|jgi:hypothetical protein
MFRLAEKFGWTEQEIRETSFEFIKSIMSIISIEADYSEWKNKGNGINRQHP